MLHDKKDTSPMNEINSFKFEENIFDKEPQEIPKKKGKGKKPKAIDLMEYAESKGIQINIQYEDLIKQTNLLSITKTKKTTQSNLSKKELISLIIEKIKENKKIKILNKTISKEIESKRTQ